MMKIFKTIFIFMIVIIMFSTCEIKESQDGMPGLTEESYEGMMMYDEEYVRQYLDSQPDVFKYSIQLPSGEFMSGYYKRNKEGYAIAEGDIILADPGEEVENVIHPGDTKSVITTASNRIWPNKIVPYIIDLSIIITDVLQQANLQGEILDAINMWENATDMNFVPLNSSHSSYINFILSNENSSYVGRRGGAKFSTIDFQCK